MSPSVPIPDGATSVDIGFDGPSSPPASKLSIPAGALNILLAFTVPTPPAPPPSSVGLPLPVYAPDSFWNVPIPANPPVDPGSALMVQKSIISYGSVAFSNTDSWGRMVYLAKSTDKLYSVVGKNKIVQCRIPAGAKPNSGSDHHMVVVDGDTETDMWLAAYDSVNDKWTAGWVGQTSVSGWGSHCKAPAKCNGPTAAGFALLGGMIRPEEIKQGHIDHALSFTTPYTRAGFIACPATHTDGKFADSAAIPEGARIQLDPTFDVNAQPWPFWQKVFARALQQFGAYLADTGGSVAFKGENDLDGRFLKWADVGVPKGASLLFVPWSKVRVLKLTLC